MINMSLLERLEKQKAPQSSRKDTETTGKSNRENEVFVDEYADLKGKVHEEMIELINQDVANHAEISDNQEEYLLKNIEQIIDSKPVKLSRADRGRLIREVYNNVVGLGPLQPLLDDPDISEIMVNGPYQIYVERKGRIELSQTRFNDNAHVMNVINRIVSSVGRHIDESSPMVDARLSDGSRFNAIIPPLALNGPTITIRKFFKNPLTVSDLVRFTSVSPKMMSFLDACVKGKLNIIVSGGTGSGKTTLLNILSGYIPNTERIITIEDAAELQLRQEHVVTLESRPPNIEGAGQITIRNLVVNSLRMRPDRIIVGEVRSAETLDMLQAMNTGHEGSMTTAHANSPRELMSRLETMVLMSGLEMPIKAIREQISSGIDLIVHQSRLRDGSRKVVNITEIVGMEGDAILLQDLFYFKEEGVDMTGKIKGKFLSTGIRPQLIDKITGSGILVKDDWFTN
jgi:pilus assembly protein CpaF